MTKSNTIKKLRFDQMSTEDDLVDLTDMHETDTLAGPTRLHDKRVLLLNADFAPISFKPLSTIPWETAFFWLSKGWDRVAKGGRPIITVVAEYDEVVHSAHQTFRIPSVVALTKMTKLPDRAAFTRGNVYLRDSYTCQYSGIRYPVSELTLDHVMPQSRGGKSNWLNLVTCHKDINFAKADRTPREAGLRLLHEPYAPSAWELREKGRSYPSKLGHESWADYVYFNVKLEELD